MTAAPVATERPADDFDLGWIKQHGVSNLRSLNSAVMRHSRLEFSGRNPALSAKGNPDAPWIYAWVRPAAEPGSWWVGVVMYGGTINYPTIPLRSDLVVPMLQHMGVTETRFDVKEVEPFALNPFGSDGHKAVTDERFVYFIRAGGSGLVKIGVAGSVAQRLKALQTASPVNLTLLAVIPGVGQAEEARLHELFAADRVRGEWFQPSARLLSYIAENGVRA